VRQAIEARGCQLLFLPSYSPDFSPIEEAFSQRHPPFYAGWERAPQKPCKRPLDKHSSPLQLTMLSAGLPIVGIAQTHRGLLQWKDLVSEKASGQDLIIVVVEQD
jgi:hypothetical protein